MRCAIGLIAIFAVHATSCGLDGKEDPGADDVTPGERLGAVPSPDVLAEGLTDPRGLVRVGSTIYVADHGAGRIVAVPTTGGSLTELVTGLNGPWMVASDGTDLFVTERGAGNVLRVTPEGTTQVLASGQTSPGRLSVRDGYVYWVAEGTGTDGAILRVTTSGESFQTLTSGLKQPLGLYVSASTCYFTERAPDDPEQIQGTYQNEPITVTVYWVSAQNRVASVPATGGTPTTLYKYDDRGLATTDAAYASLMSIDPYDVVLDEAAGKLFWTAPRQRLVFQADIGSAEFSLVNYSPSGPAWIALNSTHIFWSNDAGIHRNARSGGPFEPMAIVTTVGHFIVDETDLYWTDWQTGRLLHRALP